MKQFATLLLTLITLFSVDLFPRIIRTDDQDSSLIQTTQSNPSVVAEIAEPFAEKSTSKKQPTHKKEKKDSKPIDKKAPQLQEMAPSAEPIGVFDEKIKQIQEETEREIAELKQKKGQKLLAMQRQEELEKITEKQKALAEELERLNAKELLATEDQELISLDWKLTETARFNRLSTELADTIASGEENEAELQDFKELFNAQRDWFEKTMSNAKIVDDQHYKAILDRNSRLELLLQAQRISLPILSKEINVKKASKSEFDRASTMLLYELNSRLTDPDEWNGSLPEDQSEYIEIVKAAIAESKDPSYLKATPGNSMVNKLQKKLDEAKKRIEERNRRVLELEMSINVNQDKMSHLKKDISTAVSEKKSSEDKLKQLEQTATQDISSLKAERTKVETQLTQAQSEAKEIKNRLENLTADSTKTSQEKKDLQTQLSDLTKKIDDLQEKKRTIEKSLDEEQHKRRELELQVEQIKFKQEQAETEKKKLADENNKLDNHRKELSTQLDSKNKQVADLTLQLEQLRRELGTQSVKSQKIAVKALANVREDLEQQIHDLKIMLLKQSNKPEADISKEEAVFKAKIEAEKELKEEQELFFEQQAITPLSAAQAIAPATASPLSTPLAVTPAPLSAPAPLPTTTPAPLQTPPEPAPAKIKTAPEDIKKALDEITKRADAYLQKK